MNTAARSLYLDMRNGLPLKPLSLAALLPFVLNVASVRADSASERELTQAREQRDKAVAFAVEPINRRYQATLEQLLRKATQANDLETAVKIQNELKTLQPASSSTDLRTAIEGKEWTWERPGVSEWIKFNKGGTLLHKVGWTGTWEIAGPRTVNITTPNNSSAVLEFNDSANSYKAIAGRQQQEGVHGKKK